MHPIILYGYCLSKINRRKGCSKDGALYWKIWFEPMNHANCNSTVVWTPHKTKVHNASLTCWWHQHSISAGLIAHSCCINSCDRNLKGVTQKLLGSVREHSGVTGRNVLRALSQVYLNLVGNIVWKCREWWRPRYQYCVHTFWWSHKVCGGSRGPCIDL